MNYIIRDNINKGTNYKKNHGLLLEALHKEFVEIYKKFEHGYKILGNWISLSKGWMLNIIKSYDIGKESSYTMLINVILIYKPFTS